FYWEYQTIEPISLIVTALTGGGVAAAKDTAEKGVKDTYKGLKTFNYQQRRQWLSVITVRLSGNSCIS
ncbi:MAG: hypothetical protein ACKPH1_13980, partial [Microcystis panniformis]